MPPRSSRPVTVARLRLSRWARVSTGLAHFPQARSSVSVAAVRFACDRLFLCTLTTALALGCQGRKAPAADRAAAVKPSDSQKSPSASAPKPEPEPEPKLVVLIVVDQMRFDYFDRFGPQWQHGFKRLRAESRYFSAAYHEHALTETGPGHATISTGANPAGHGIVANHWLDRRRGTTINAVDDPSTTLIGSKPSADPSASSSAANLLRTGVGDWVQAADPTAIVISMAVKDRAAILLGGKRPDAALWYDDALGGFVTSSFYDDDLPAWVDAYNAKSRARALYGEHGWTLSRAKHDYGDSRAITDPKLVATFNDYSLTKQFPHVIDKHGKTPRNVIRDTPFADQMTLELAREAIAAEHMGADEVGDLLLIGLSAGDYAGHRYGPNSVEIHDYYLRIDAALGSFVADLDRSIGADNYVLILTSDHGVAAMPEHSKLATAGRFEAKRELPKLLERAAATLKFDADAIPRVSLSHGVDLVFPTGVSEAERTRLRAGLAELLREHELIADAWTRDELMTTVQRNEFAAEWRRSFHPQRSSDILIQVAPGVSMYPDGTGHGTPYEYDQHVPLLIRGSGWSEVENERVSTVDIAPTIASMLHVAVPEGVDGVARSPAGVARSPIPQDSASGTDRR